MGWGIDSIGNHTLDTSSLGILARQLSDALDVNIDYGYFNIVKYNEVTHQVEFPDDYKFIKLGRITKARNRKLYRLTDNYYNEKIVYQKFGGKIENVVYAGIDDEDTMEYFKFLVETGFEFLNRERLSFDLYPCANAQKRRENNQLWYANVYNDVITICIFHPFRWFDFVEQLKENCNYFDVFAEYRKRMADLYRNVGSNQVFYFADQGVTQLIWDRLSDTDWCGVVKYIESKSYYDDYIKIDFYDKVYHEWALKEFEQRHKALQVSISDFFLQGKPFYKESANLEVLFDDFKDLLIP